MKKIGFLLFALVLSTAFIFAQNTKKDTKAAKAEFTSTVHNFGKIAENGGNVTHNFEFTNTGDAPLIVQRVQTSCGCTTPDYTREPILPGKKGIITVSFSPQGRPGAFDKRLIVFTNVPDEVYTITVKGEVLLK